jgi:hypothetical protein
MQVFVIYRSCSGALYVLYMTKNKTLLVREAHGQRTRIKVGGQMWQIVDKIVVMTSARQT